jgi:hypothetical protein
METALEPVVLIKYDFSFPFASVKYSSTKVGLEKLGRLPLLIVELLSLTTRPE